MPLRLRQRAETNLAIEAEELVGMALNASSLLEVERHRVWHGNRQESAGELFAVSGTAGDGRLELEGDLSRVHRLGEQMSGGEVHIEGNAGRHVGARMSGGTIEIAGSAGDWLGAEMRGGSIRVRGSAGDLAGAAYRGSKRGMRGGTIIVDGAAGVEVAHSMRRGLIAIGGSVGDFAAVNMIAGTLLVVGAVEGHAGAGMRRGTLLACRQPRELLPTFTRGSHFRPQFVALYWRWLARRGFSVPDDAATADYEIYHGDRLAGGRGEILVQVTRP